MILPRCSTRPLFDHSNISNMRRSNPVAVDVVARSSIALSLRLGCILKRPAPLVSCPHFSQCSPQGPNVSVWISFHRRFPLYRKPLHDTGSRRCPLHGAHGAVESARELSIYCRIVERGVKGTGRHLYIPHTPEALTCWGYMQTMQDLSVLLGGGSDHGCLPAGKDDHAAVHSVVRALCARASRRAPGERGGGGFPSSAESLSVPERGGAGPEHPHPRETIETTARPALEASVGPED
jgi:hypothetical protein